MRALGFIFFAIFIINLNCTLNVKDSDIFSPQKRNYSFSTLTKYSPETGFYKTKDNTDIEYLFLKQEKAKANIIVFGGRDWDFKEGFPFYDILSRYISVNIFTINYRGFGSSKGKPSIDGVLEDANTSLEFFKDHYKEYSKYPTFVLGYSLGGFFASAISDNKNILGLIIISTFTTGRDMVDFLEKERVPFFVKPFVKFDIDQKVYLLNNSDIISKFNKPLLIIHGEDDYFIPTAMSKKLFELSKSTNKKLSIVRDVGHNAILTDELYLKEVANIIKDFIDEAESKKSASYDNKKYGLTVEK